MAHFVFPGKLETDAASASTDLTTNPRVLVQILPEPRTVSAIAIPGTMHARYRIPYGVLIPWETLIFKTSSMESVSVTIPEGIFMIEELKTTTIMQLMHRFLEVGGVTRFMPVVPVALPDSFQRALPKFENQDAYDAEDLRQRLHQSPTRLQQHGAPPESEQGVAVVATLFSGGLLAWRQEKVVRAAPDKKETAGYDGITMVS